MVVGFFRQQRDAAHETERGDEIGEGEIAADGGSIAGLILTAQHGERRAEFRFGQFLDHELRLHLAKSV